ncbi:MAG: hypothetical protein IPN94_16020 [Sphingobacteriales bacterium]|nr:hypothetical protein [Sphingobacteriales bacterium]
MMIQYYTPRLVKHLITVFCFCVSANILAQNLDILYDFNTCTLPPAWLSTGQGTGLWGVGIPTNAGSQGSSIDGTCMLYFDDDGAGNNTPTWNRQLTSPAFDATVNTHVYIDMDVHYRDGDYAANYRPLVISVFDGNTYQPLKYTAKDLTTQALCLATLNTYTSTYRNTLTPICACKYSFGTVIFGDGGLP